MSAVLVMLLFAVAFAASVWTLYSSVRPQLHRYRALFATAPVLTQPPLRVSRVTVRWTAPVRIPVQALRVAA